MVQIVNLQSKNKAFYSSKASPGGTHLQITHKYHQSREVENETSGATQCSHFQELRVLEKYNSLPGPTYVPP